ncbi:phage baseplate plug family protein [Solibacillus silvestris]
MDFEHIAIEKELVPYRFEIELGVEKFELRTRYNELHDYFTLDLLKDDEVLVYGEKLTYGVPLFSEVFDARFPVPTIIPMDEACRETRVSYENLSKTVFLMVVNKA